ncbi:MAG: universal stress protein [Actinomycetota bacterium]
MYKKILIATDGSPTAGKAVATGASLAKSVGAGLLLLHVGEPADGKTVLEDASGRAAGVKGLQTKSVSGDPADMICDVAESEGADLIVVGNKGMTGAKRFLLGSVPNQVSHHAPCNVLIVKTT